MDPRSWITLFVVAVGNCGFWLACFNRINAVGLSRRTTKRSEKAIVAACFLIPSLVLLREHAALWEWLTQPDSGWWPNQARLFNTYGSWCAASFMVLGILWANSRRDLMPPACLRHSKSEIFDVNKLLGGRSIIDPKTRMLNRIPGNEIGWLDVSHKQLRLPRQIPWANGLRIAHVSDLHFTGQYSLEHYEFIANRVNQSECDLVVVTGDIVDYAEYIDWAEKILDAISPPGCQCRCFVLGNHDRRMADPDVERLTESLTSIGYFDLGKDRHTLAISGGHVSLTGNEQPWFRRQDPAMHVESPAERPGPQELRIGVSHTPDQLGWARQNSMDLLLAGHNHGGQIRLPLIGPFLSPSYHGSRFAAGAFFRPPTIMHVSRGIGGTHAVRWRCKPEVSLLTIQCE